MDIGGRARLKSQICAEAGGRARPKSREEGLEGVMEQMWNWRLKWGTNGDEMEMHEHQTGIYSRWNGVRIDKSRTLIESILHSTSF